MKLTRFLMGSAAALITCSGAQAAGSIVEAEPDNQHYVRVCDMYGSGFFYIPGTETCLNVSGEIRLQYNTNEIEWKITGTGSWTGDIINNPNFGIYGGVGYPDDDGRGVIGHFAGDTHTTSPSWYGRVNFDARNETEFGTLRSYIRTESVGGTNEGDEANLNIRDTYLELAGFSTGYRTSRVELTGLPGQMFDGEYHGGGRSMYADYTLSKEGVSLMVGGSLDQDVESADSFDPYARVDYAGKYVSLGAVFANDTSEDSTVYGVYASVMPLDGLVIGGYYNEAESANQFSPSPSALETVETSYLSFPDAHPGKSFLQNLDVQYDQLERNNDQRWGVGASYDIVDNLNIALGFYGFKTDLDYTGFDDTDPTIITAKGTGSIEGRGISANVAWTIAPNLILQFGYNRVETDGYLYNTDEMKPCLNCGDTTIPENQWDNDRFRETFYSEVTEENYRVRLQRNF